MIALLVAWILAAGPAAAAPYGQELTVRLWGGLGSALNYDARIGAHDETLALAVDNWNGAIDETALGRVTAGGGEVSWGIDPQVKLLLALEGRGVSAQSTFTGEGPAHTVVLAGGGLAHQTIDRLDRYSAAGAEVGATFLVRELGETSRLGLTLRLGMHTLAGSLERGHETGPQRDYWWERDLTGTAVGGLLGLEWEWTQPWPSFPVTGFLLAGYRTLNFGHISFSYADSTGATVTGGWNTPAGGRRSVDFSGAEIRLGVELISVFDPARDPLPEP